MLTHQTAGIDFQHQMRTAPQVQAQRDLVLGKEVRNRRQHARRQHIGESGQDAKQNGNQVNGQSQPRNMHSSLPACVLVRAGLLLL